MASVSTKITKTMKRKDGKAKYTINSVRGINTYTNKDSTTVTSISYRTITPK